MGSMGILKAWRRSSHLGTGASLVRTGTTIDDADANTELMPRREECSPARDKGGSRIRGFEVERESADGGWEEADLVPLSVSRFRRC